MGRSQKEVFPDPARLLLSSPEARTGGKDAASNPLSKLAKSTNLPLHTDAEVGSRDNIGADRCARGHISCGLQHARSWLITTASCRRRRWTPRCGCRSWGCLVIDLLARQPLYGGRGWRCVQLYGRCDLSGTGRRALNPATFALASI